MIFLSGNSYKKISGFIFDETGFYKNQNVENNICFVKTDYIDDFFKHNIPDYPFKLITHNSDYLITEKYRYGLNHSNLIKWFAQEANIDHPKLEHIPIGLPNERIVKNDAVLEHFHFGAREVFERLVFEPVDKSKIVSEITFDINTNPDRKNCLKICEKMNMFYNRLNYEDYLLDIKKSMFCVCPPGNCPSSHRLWEALHLKCIPILLSTSHWYYNKLPIIFLEKWEDMLNLTLTKEVYDSYTKDFKLEDLDGNKILNKILNTDS
jgi:hypothetical protein